MTSREQGVETFRPGIYRHYKGGLYRALFLARDHETQWPVVVYVPLQVANAFCEFPSPPQIRNLVDGPEAWLSWGRVDVTPSVARFEWVSP